MDSYRIGYVTIIGKPNVGKSTLLNTICNKKVSIVSPAAGTTRFSITAMKKFPQGQIIFFDTPGIYKPKNQLEKYMYEHSYNSILGADIILFMINATEGFCKTDLEILDKLKRILGRGITLLKEKTSFEKVPPIFLVVNKIDLINSSREVIKELVEGDKHFDFNERIHISATKNINVDVLVDKIFCYLPIVRKEEGLKLSEEMFCLPLRLEVSEIIREKIFQNVYDEIPQSTCVIVEDIRAGDVDKNKVLIEATIIVEKSRHKGIIIGENGRKLKTIGTSARKEIESVLKKPVFLSLKVKEKEHWRDKPDFVSQLGF